MNTIIMKDPNQKKAGVILPQYIIRIVVTHHLVGVATRQMFVMVQLMEVVLIVDYMGEAPDVITKIIPISQAAEILNVHNMYVPWYIGVTNAEQHMEAVEHVREYLVVH